MIKKLRGERVMVVKREIVGWLKRFGWSEEEIRRIFAEGRRLPARRLTWLKLWLFKRVKSLGYPVGEARRITGLSKKALTQFRWILREPDVFDILSGCEA